MFTIGIFTTHLPYIAFIAFYAFFVLLGTDKSPAEDLQETDSQIIAYYNNQHSITATADNPTPGTSKFTDSFIFSPASNEYDNAGILHRYTIFTSICLKQLTAPENLFCRPPPAFI